MLRIRNESRRIGVKSVPKQATQPSSLDCVNPASKIPFASQSICKSIDQPHQDSAINFFFYHYADGSHMKYLKSLYASDTGASAFHGTLAAVSLICLSYSRNAPYLRREARFKYVRALRDVNIALKGHPKAIGENTVASIMLLALFVALSHEMVDSTEQWSTHINGALSIIMIQSREHFSTFDGQHLLHHVLSMKQIDCLQRGVAIPASLTRLYECSLAGRYQRCFWDTLHELAALRIPAPATSFVEHSCLIRRLYVLDEQIYQLKSSVETAFATEDFQEREWCWPKAPDLELEHVRAYNTLRIMQISVLEGFAKPRFQAGFKCTEDEERYLAQELEKATTLVEVISIEILDGVSSWIRRIQEQEGSCDSVGAWGNSFIWPLVIVGKCPLLSKSLRECANEHLVTISNKAGLPEALAATIRLRQGRSGEGWSHALYLT